MDRQVPFGSDRIISHAEVEELLGVCKHTLYRMRRRGEIPEPIRISKGRVGWRASTFTAWLDEREREAAAAARTRKQARVQR